MSLVMTATDPRSNSSTPAPEQQRILVAEDHPVNQLIARKLLEKKGYRVTVVGDGVQAVETWSAAPEEIDAILMDIQMPRCNGLEATRQIRELEQYMSCRTPIIAFTAFTADHEREDCLASGMDGYLTKPVEPAILYQTHAAAMAA